MKIDKKKLVELLVDRTGMEKAEVEDQLEQLINRIIDAAERGKALEIKEFGLFYFDEDGELKFDPATELSTEINFKYAGMEPVELKPPRDEDADTEDIEISDEPVEQGSAKREEEPEETEEELATIFGFDDDEGIEGKDEEEKIDPFATDEEEEDTEPAPNKKKEKEPVSSETKKESSEEPEEDEEEDIKPREDDPFAGLLSDASTKLTASDKRDFDEDDDKELDDPLFAPPKPEKKPDTKPQPQKEPAKAGTPPAGKRAASTPKKEAPGPKPKPAAARRTSEPKQDPIMVVIAVVLVFVLIAAGFLLIPGMFQTDDRELPPQQPPVTSEPAPVPEQEDAVNVLTPVEPGAETEVTDDVAAADEITPETQPEQPRYGLTGDLVEAANDGFSIVLHSLAREDNAREQAARLAADGYRVLVSPRTVQNQTVWRVSVGQFQTIADAQEHARELPSPYNTNNFIQRIQVN
jgi:nucleoid DNA-binding protein/cell division septation protein DedD